MKQPDNDKYFVFAATSLLANRLQVIGSSVTGTITFKQWLVMLIIRDMPDGSSLTDIAEQHGSTRQNVKKLLDGLSRQGYVTLKQHESDKRSYAVFMTDKGASDMQRISKVGGEFVESLFAGTDAEDVAGARRVIMQLLINLDEFDEE